jgi:small subunit ribosomal protein S17
MSLEPKKRRKVLEGTVLSNKMEKTVAVRVDRRLAHADFNKVVNRSKKYYAHTEEVIETGQKVRIMETRPLSKLKRWRVVEVL